MRKSLEPRPQVTIKRVKELAVGDLFMYNWIEWEVIKRDEERVYFDSTVALSGNRSSLGAKSMMMVEYIGKSLKSKYNQNDND